MKGLRTLDLRHNSITNLPKGMFKDLHELEYVNINDNALNYIDADIFPSIPYTELRELDLSRNQLTTLDVWPLGLRCQDCTVRFQRQQIANFTNLHNSVFRCNSTEIGMTLDLSDNEFQHFSDLIEGWNFSSAEEFLCLFANQSTAMFQMILSSTALVCDCQDFSFIKHVQIDSTNLGLSHAVCSASKSLQCKNVNVRDVSLDELVCQTTVDCPDGCNCTDQPSTMSMIINCTNAGLKDLPNKLPLLHSPGYKYRLDLTNNAIVRLDYRDYLENTSSLDVSNSAVEEIDSGIWKAFQSMDEIGLKNNLLNATA